MKSALITGRSGTTAEVVKGVVFEKKLAADPTLLERVNLLNPDTGAPLIYVPAYSRNGHSEKISAHFKHVKGYAPKVDHVFDRSTSTVSIKDALAEGKKILLSLNLDLSYRSLDFSQDQKTSVQNIDRWKSQNKYLSVSIKDIDDVVAVGKMVKDGGYNPKESIFASYGHGVMPYQDFYIGKRDERIVQLYNNMLNGNSGVNIGQTRQVGFPRLMRFAPAQTTLDQGGAHGIRGSRVEFNDKVFLNYIVFSNPTKDIKREFTAKAMDMFKKGEKDIGVYVLASPTISTGHQADNPEDYWRNIRWVVNNPETQIRVPEVPSGYK